MSNGDLVEAAWRGVALVSIIALLVVGLKLAGILP